MKAQSMARINDSKTRQHNGARGGGTKAVGRNDGGTMSARWWHGGGTLHDDRTMAQNAPERHHNGAALKACF